MPPLTRVLLLFAAGIGSGTLAAGESVFRHEYSGHADTFVEIESVFGPAANQGSLPFRVTLRNHSGKTRVWTVRFTEGGPGRALTTRSEWNIEVGHGSEVRRELTFAFAPAFLAYYYRNLAIEVSAPGLPTQMRQVSEQLPQGFPLLAISQSLAERSLGRLDEEAKRRFSGTPWFAKRFDPAQLPIDWLGYSGLDGLLLDLPAWRALSAAQRQALTSWVRLGGRLDLFAEKSGETPPDPPFPGLLKPGDRILLSFGEVGYQTWDGKELDAGILGNYGGMDPDHRLLEEDFSGRWGLLGEFGTKTFNSKPVFFLVLAFAILVAPVNLFVLAGPGRRHRLFLTTPLISLGTCLLIVLLIYFIDGIGGSGLRVVLADLQTGGGETRIYTTQEQVSRTGVMVRPGFAADRALDLQPVNLPQSRFNPFSTGAHRPTTFEIDPGRGIHAGPYFRSRSEQGYVLRAADPGRARIDRGGEEDGAPVLVSNLPGEIVELCYRDAEGELWTSAPGATIAPGGRIVLVKAVDRDPPGWIGEAAAWFSPARQERLRLLQNEKNRFFARVRDPEAFALATHPRLRWKRTVVLLTGTPAAP